MSKQTELVGLARTTNLDEVNAAYSAGALSNRNLIINGAMQVAQRGTSFTANGYGLDRWKTYNSGGTATLSQQTFASGSSPEVGLDTYVRIVRSSPSGIYWFSQKVEDVRKSDGATLTLSFYAKASSATTIPCRITQEFGTGGSAGVNITAQNSNVTTSWQKFSLTFNMASLSGKTIGTGSSFEPVFDIPATTATIEITGVQLEVGDTVTPFEHRSYGDELARCQRYYNEFGGISYAAILTGMQQSTTISSGALTYPTMRAAPAIGFFDLIATDRTAFDYTAIQNGSIAGTKSAYVRFTHPAVGSSRNAILLAVRNLSSGKLTLDAEL